MRRHGVVGSVGGLGVHDHVCLPFDDEGEFRAAAVEFLRDGRRLGQRLVYVGGAAADELREDIAGLEGLDRLLADGSLEILSLADVYPASEPIDVEAQLEVYRLATERALADGYTGLRVAAHATALATEPVMWNALARWEGVADRYMATKPFAAMCAYDRRIVPEQVVADLACVHPVARASRRIAPFQLYSTPDGLALAGEVDYFSADALGRLLALAPRGRGETAVDLSELEFIDHHGLAKLAENAGGEGGLRYEAASPHVRRLCDLLEIELAESL